MAELVASRALATITLALSAVLVTILISIPLGAWAALKPNSWADRVALGVAVSAQAIPNFWLGLIMIILFAVTFPIFPVSGDDSWRHFILPAFVLGASSVPAVMRLTRIGLIEVMDSDYIRTARSKGFRGAPLLTPHAMRSPACAVLALHSDDPQSPASGRNGRRDRAEPPREPSRAASMTPIPAPLPIRSFAGHEAPAKAGVETQPMGRAA